MTDRRRDNPAGDDDLRIDPDLLRDLRDLMGVEAAGGVEDSPRLAALDHSVLNAARARLKGAAGLSHRRRTIGLITAAAAACIIAAIGLWQFAPVGNGDAGGPASPARIAGDVNGDGRVDVIDAYLLARSLRAGESIDLPVDGGDRRSARADDVEAIMQRIVALHSAAPGPFGEGGGS